MISKRSIPNPACFLNTVRIGQVVPSITTTFATGKGRGTVISSRLPCLTNYVIRPMHPEAALQRPCSQPELARPQSQPSTTRVFASLKYCFLVVRGKQAVVVRSRAKDPCPQAHGPSRACVCLTPLDLLIRPIRRSATGPSIPNGVVQLVGALPAGIGRRSCNGRPTLCGGSCPSYVGLQSCCKQKMRGGAPAGPTWLPWRAGLGQ
jgi:hypothetical protein